MNERLNTPYIAASTFKIASAPAIGWPAIVWYVGWHATKGDTLFFALNINMMNMTEKHHRHPRTQIVGMGLRLVQQEPQQLSKP